MTSTKPGKLALRKALGTAVLDEQKTWSSPVRNFYTASFLAWLPLLSLEEHYWHESSAENPPRLKTHSWMTLRNQEYQGTSQTIQAVWDCFKLLQHFISHEPSLKPKTAREELEKWGTGFLKSLGTGWKRRLWKEKVLWRARFILR